MKFIKQSSIDNLIDEARIDVVIGATEELKRKVFTISAFLLLRAKRNSFFMCACCKELFYDNSAGLVETPCSSS
jgi:hypothetical protein